MILPAILSKIEKINASSTICATKALFFNTTRYEGFRPSCISTRCKCEPRYNYYWVKDVWLPIQNWKYHQVHHHLQLWMDHIITVVLHSLIKNNCQLYIQIKSWSSYDHNLCVQVNPERENFQLSPFIHGTKVQFAFLTRMPFLTQPLGDGKRRKTPLSSWIEEKAWLCPSRNSHFSTLAIPLTIL